MRFVTLSLVRRHVGVRSKHGVKIYQFKFTFYKMAVVLLPVFVWGLRMVTVLLFSAPSTSEETFLPGGYNFIFPVTKCSM